MRLPYIWSPFRGFWYSDYKVFGNRIHDDMVVKALSWALRELSKREEEPIRKFMNKNDSRLAGRVRREVWNKLNIGRKN